MDGSIFDVQAALCHVGRGFLVALVFAFSDDNAAFARLVSGHPDRVYTSLCSSSMSIEYRLGYTAGFEQSEAQQHCISNTGP